MTKFIASKNWVVSQEDDPKQYVWNWETEAGDYFEIRLDGPKRYQVYRMSAGEGAESSGKSYPIKGYHFPTLLTAQKCV